MFVYESRRARANVNLVLEVKIIQNALQNIFGARVDIAPAMQKWSFNKKWFPHSASLFFYTYSSIGDAPTCVQPSR